MNDRSRLRRVPSSAPIARLAFVSAMAIAWSAFAAPPAALPPISGEPPVATDSASMVPAIDPVSRAATLRQAQRLLDEGDFAAAEPLLAEARAIAGDPRLAYNLGLCAFEAGRFGEAATLFEEASLAADAALAERAMFNQGNARYRQGVEMVEAASPPPEAPPTSPADTIAALEQALEPLRSARTHFRDAMRSDPKDRDARANAELAHRTIREIERTIESLRRQEQEQQEQQEQQQDQQQQGENSDQQQGEQDQSQEGSDQDQSGQQDQPQNDSQQQQQSGQQGEQPNDSQQQQQSGQQGEQPNDSQQQQNQSGQQGEPNQAGEQRQTPPPAVDPMDALGGAEPTEASAVPEGELAAASEAGEPSQAGEKKPGVAAAPARLSKEQAERLLQLIRDKEQQRRVALALERQRQRQRTPVRQDW